MTTYGKKWKNLVLVLSLLFVFFIGYKSIRAITNEDNQILNSLKDGSETADFNYQLNLEETISVLYKDSSINNLVTKYIINRTDDKYLVEVKDVSNSGGVYNVLYNGGSYTGDFTYSFTNKLNIDLVDNDRIKSIKDYIRDKYSINDDIDVTYKGRDIYNIRINLKDYDFNIEFNTENTISTFNSTENNNVNNSIAINYQAHVESIGWQSYVNNGETAGTTGQSKQMEALKIKIVNNTGITGGIEYQTHVESIGWQNYVSNDETAGTTGQGKQIVAIRIRLTGDLANSYDIYYRVHVSDIGWMAWTCNDEAAGTSGFGKQVEAIEIKLVKKGDEAPDTTGNAYLKPEQNLEYQAHVESIGWQNYVNNGETAGTTGQGKQVEALKVKISNQDLDGKIEYQAYVESIGWQSYVSDGEIAGTTGQGKQVEAIRIRLTGDLANSYDIYYRVHISEIGWMAWTCNDKAAGTVGFSKQVEAIEIRLIKKGDETPEINGDSYVEKGTDINYSSHVSEIGWQNNVKNGLTSGTTGQGKQIEAIKIAVSSSLAGNITYQTYIEKTGWQNNVNNGEISGTTGLGRKIETIKISLNGTISSYYDVYYRTHVSNVGWLDWTCNGQPSGSSGIDMAIEAIEIVLVPKGADAPGATTNAYVTGKWVTDSNNNTYYYDAFGNMARDFKMIDGVKYFFNSLGVLIGSNVKKVIDVSKHQGIIDWETIKRNGDVDAVILRVAAGYAKVDDMFARNVSELNRLGIPYGIYLYSYAENQIGYAEGLGRMHEGALEAMRIIKTIKDYNVNLSLPIYYDLEKWKGSTINQNWTIDNYRPIVEAFDKVMTEYGYNSSWAIYANKYWAEDRLYEWDNRIRWIAQYNHYCYYKGSYDMWQYSSTESVAGINGDVDVSVLFS